MLYKLPETSCQVWVKPSPRSMTWSVMLNFKPHSYKFWSTRTLHCCQLMGGKMLRVPYFLRNWILHFAFRTLGPNWIVYPPQAHAWTCWNCPTLRTQRHSKANWFTLSNHRQASSSAKEDHCRTDCPNMLLLIFSWMIMCCDNKNDYTTSKKVSPS